MSFSRIKGHDNIVAFFKKALNLNRIGHSYLFFGPDGVGKTLTASTLAKALNCDELHNDCCDKCVPCAKIDNKNHPDVMWLEIGDKKDAVSIEQIRELERQISLKPYEARTKVFIVSRAHLMSEAAANCLLKTLEEPPKNSVIILITSRYEDILPTVKSRCTQIKFEPLELNCRTEMAKAQGITKEEAIFLSRLEGGVQFEDNGLFDYKNRVLDEFGSQKDLLDENSFIFNESKEKMKFIISILGSWFRDIIVLKIAGPASVVINSDRIEELKKQRDRFSFEELEDILGKINDARFCIDRNVGPKLAFNDLKMKLTGKAEAQRI